MLQEPDRGRIGRFQLWRYPITCWRAISHWFKFKPDFADFGLFSCKFARNLPDLALPSGVRAPPLSPVIAAVCELPEICRSIWRCTIFFQNYDKML